MGKDTGIEWTDATWNCIRGCSRVSEGCRHCYAEGIARRFRGIGLAYEGLVRIDTEGNAHEWNGKIKFVEKHLLDPLKWKEPKRIFVNSMSDLFHVAIQDEVIDKIFAVMALCPQHTFQILTKRPERMARYMTEIRQGPERSLAGGVVRDMVYRWDRYNPTTRLPNGVMHEHRLDSFQWPLLNVHMGVSCENQATADERIPLLLQTPAAVRFISAEPLLGPIDLLRIPRAGQMWDWLTGERETASEKRTTAHLDWAIVGGESGPGARPMHPDWARSLRDQCQAAGVSFFFKQWGEWSPDAKGSFPVARVGEGLQEYQLLRVGKKAAGATLDGREWREFPA